MTAKIIKVSRNTDHAPKSAVATQSVAFSHYNNISAQLPLDPNTNKLVAGDISAQTKQCLSNLKAIVANIDHSMDDVVKVNIFLQNIADLEAVDKVYQTFFSNYLPTRSAIAVAALPLDGALIQIDAVISNGEGTPPQEPSALIKLDRNTTSAPQSSVSTQSVAFSHYNNLSAQLPIDAKTGQLIAGDVSAQAEQCLKNIHAILTNIEVPFDDIVKINIVLTKASDIDAVNQVYRTFFPDSAIARTLNYLPARTITIASALPMGALVQIDAVVAHGDGTPPQAVEDRHNIVIRAHNTDKAAQCSLSTQSVAFSHYNHISAQLPLDAKAAQLVTGDTQAQAKQCLSQLKAIIESIDHEMDDIVKLNIQLQNITDLAAINEICPSFFSHELPAITTFAVAEIALGAQVQMDAVVANAEGTPPG
ncbi:reactive intermediate/imine deaminase [Colwellia chukchiensis]|uniref:Reactive intermediate/imine deaminase n=1 Tax=Colwellia chukchiensis TaxID=641665 RepID=A0A1H7ISQ4_9GAMM|nr:RidA family protein [Colwellia chukchiensis]SEK65314.1 reactive intermediate/imine deaminase [Colwellia chukchiensis]